MRLVLFGATGMVGQGVLREALLDEDVTRVVSVGRAATGTTHPKLEEIVHSDLLDLSPVEDRLQELDACVWCLGISSNGLNEQEYTRITHDFTIAAANTLHRLNPGMRFVLVSAVGADSTERGRIMWARVKGRTENALQTIGFRSAHSVRPAVIIPMHGITSRTRLYRVFYAALGPVLPLVRRLFPGATTTTEQLGRALLQIARNGHDKGVLETVDVVRL